MTYVPGSAWRPIKSAIATIGPQAAAVDLVFYDIGTLVSGADASAFGAFYLDPAALKINRVRLDARCIPNAVGPGTGFWFALSRVLTWGGASGGRATVATKENLCLTPVYPSGGGPSRNAIDAAAPVAGYYVFSVLTEGAIAANSNVEMGVELQVARL
jgi:hypothetical protein